MQVNGNLVAGEAPECANCDAPLFKAQDYYRSGGRYFLMDMLSWRHIHSGKIRCYGYPSELEAYPKV